MSSVPSQNRLLPQSAGLAGGGDAGRERDFTIFGNYYVQGAFHNLTDPQVYQNFIRPRGNCKGHRDDGDTSRALKPLAVNMSLELYNYATVDELTSEYTFQFFLDLEWCDERLILLAPSPSPLQDDAPFEEKYAYLEGGQWHIDRIWHPSIFVANNGEQAGSIDNDRQSSNMIRIDGRSGRIWLRKRKMLQIYCLMDFSLFPFDRQHCSVHFEVNIDNHRALELSWGEIFIDRSTPIRGPYRTPLPTPSSLHVHRHTPDKILAETIIYNHSSFHTIGFQLVDIHLSSSLVSGLSGVNFSRCSFDFTLQREYHHHLLLTYLPSGLIVLVSWAGFWLEITSPPARVSLGVTTMLALVTNFKLARGALPTVSYLNVLDIWNLVCITYIAFSLIEFAIVNFLYNTSKRRQIVRNIKKRSQKYKRSHRESGDSLRSQVLPLGRLPAGKSPLEESFSRIIDDTSYSNQETLTLDFKAKDKLTKMASFNSIIQKRDAAFSSAVQAELNSQTTHSMVELLGFTPLTEKKDANAPLPINQIDFSPIRRSNSNIVSFATAEAPAEPNPGTPRLTRKFTTNSQSGVGPGTVTPVMKRFNSSEPPPRRNSDNSVNFPPSRSRRRSVFISSNLDVPAIFELTPEELAQKIDYWSRWIFPATFLLFNGFYWMAILVRKANSEAPRW